jgi:hypothetical protein
MLVLFLQLSYDLFLALINLGTARPGATHLLTSFLTKPLPAKTHDPCPASSNTLETASAQASANTPGNSHFDCISLPLGG